MKTILLFITLQCLLLACGPSKEELDAMAKVTETHGPSTSTTNEAIQLRDSFTVITNSNEISGISAPSVYEPVELYLEKRYKGYVVKSMKNITPEESDRIWYEVKMIKSN